MPNGYGYGDFFAQAPAGAGGGYGQPQGVIDPWQALISQGIEAARDVARGATSNYPYVSPDDPYARRPLPDVNVYAPPPPSPAPGGFPLPLPVAPGQPGGIQLSQTTLMLLVGGVLLFMLGTKKGR